MNAPDPVSSLDATCAPDALTQGVWASVQAAAAHTAATEPLLSAHLRRFVLELEPQDILARVLGAYFAEPAETAPAWAACVRETLDEDPRLLPMVSADLAAVAERDAATHSRLQALLYRKGFHALLIHRIAHRLWLQERRELAQYAAFVCTRALAVDIHPAAVVGSGILLDHATGLVIGETARVGDNVSILHNVTLGGTGKSRGDRHPKVADGVLIGAGATLLGNIQIGRCSKIAAGSVVLKDVPAYATVAGVPARVVRQQTFCTPPADSMDQQL